MMVVPCKTILLFSVLFDLILQLALLCDARRGHHHRNHTKNRIIDGEEALEGEFPEHVVLEITSGANKKLSCGGVLLRNNVVLTAATCVEGNIYVYASTTIYSPHTWTEEMRKKAIRVDTTCISDEFYQLDYKNFYDYAILRLEKPFEDAKIAEMADSRILIERPAVGIGIGLTHLAENPKMNERARRLRKLELESSVCSAYNQGDDHICFTAKKGGDICIGDTGSPVFNNDHEIVALASYSDPGKLCRHGTKGKSIYADVGGNKNLITDLMTSCLNEPVPPEVPEPTSDLRGEHHPSIKESKSKHRHHRHH